MKFTIEYQLGKRIKYLREKNKLSQEDLALDSNVSKNYLSDVECGRRNPSVRVLERIAKGLKVSLSELFLGVGDKNN